jgi:hypothetical protein
MADPYGRGMVVLRSQFCARVLKSLEQVRRHRPGFVIWSITTSWWLGVNNEACSA